MRHVSHCVCDFYASMAYERKKTYSSMDEAFQDIFSNDFEDSSSEYGDSSSKEEISGVYSDLDQLTQGMFLNLFAIFKYFGIDTVYCTIAD